MTAAQVRDFCVETVRTTTGDKAWTIKCIQFSLDIDRATAELYYNHAVEIIQAEVA